MSSPRLLSLLPSATEVIHALGLGKYQVGRSHECDYPSSVLNLPVCTRPAISVAGSSAEIDCLVKGRLASALSIYEIDDNLLRMLQPTHIVTQTQCKVCAVSLEDVHSALIGQLGVAVQVIPLEAYSLDGLWSDVHRVARACGAAETGETLVAALQERMDTFEKRACAMKEHPRVAAIEWLNPLMAAGNWIPELIEKAGGINLFGTAGQHSPWMNEKQLIEADPDIIIAMPCGFDLPRTRSEMAPLATSQAWKGLKAVKNRRVFLCDGNQYMNRPGPRLADSLQIFAEIFHPEQFAPTLEGVGWERWRA